ncbi:hypothetical protein [Thermogemmatispora sp.]|uniref:hypothetical protein n=1 Tax=Thermogemmatispora sp. TaxID=1968838 RepID=UPI001D2D1EAA|nr:hypothetical protein [Thermogemmatispora sp.]MBX5450848.1 hypothetical protein [Thermogemmatispora sp.]
MSAPSICPRRWPPLHKGELERQVIDRVIPLECLVPNGFLALAEGRAYGKILLDPRT